MKVDWVKALKRFAAVAIIVLFAIGAIYGSGQLFKADIDEETGKNTLMIIGYVFMGGWALAMLGVLVDFVVDDTAFLYSPENKILRTVIAFIPLAICCGFATWVMVVGAVSGPLDGTLLFWLAMFCLGTILLTMLVGLIQGLLFPLFHWIIFGSFISIQTLINFNYDKKRGLWLGKKYWLEQGIKKENIPDDAHNYIRDDDDD